MKKRLMYGTSDHLANHAEVIMTEILGRHLNLQPTFLYYPKGENWTEREKSLFDPYSKSKECEMVNGFFPAIFMKNNGVEFFSLQEIFNKSPVIEMTMGSVAEKIRKNRERKSFLAVNNCSKKPIYVSSKNKRWKELAPKKISDILNDPSLKIGGTFIYFLFGAYLGNSLNSVGVLPNKTHNDILGAFWTGAELTGKAAVIYCGEFDFMTLKQWQMRKKDGLWRKAPYWAMKALKENPRIMEKVERRLISGKYSPLAYDEDNGKFFFLKN